MATNDPGSNPDDRIDPGGVKPPHDIPPFRESGSGTAYSPDGNWGAERQGSSTGAGAADLARTIGEGGGIGSGASTAGTPTDAGDGGYGPEGDYSGDGQPGGQPGGESAGGSAADEPGNHAQP